MSEFNFSTSLIKQFENLVSDDNLVTSFSIRKGPPRLKQLRKKILKIIVGNRLQGIWETNETKKNGGGARYSQLLWLITTVL